MFVLSLLDDYVVTREGVFTQAAWARLTPKCSAFDLANTNLLRSARVCHLWPGQQEEVASGVALVHLGAA